MNLKLAAVTIVLLGVFSRLLPHPPNFSPITALALFGGAYLPKKFAFLPLLALLISDFFIGFYGIDMLYVYGSFGLVGLIGLWLKNNKKPILVISSALSSSVLFFLITNFGVWAPPNNWYPYTFAGLMQSYTLAIPFFRNTLLGDLVWTVSLFGGYELVQIWGKKYLPQTIVKLVF
ncbi:hypothetical protein HYZ06_02585 [Candidatus Daviesbacteria bacterium]|nr:hypothetical protein [Candidatus Daviesbacteria bacterium]